MNLRQPDVVVPAFAERLAPGGKCVHGVYIPSNQERQDFAEFCDLCRCLKAAPVDQAGPAVKAA